MTNIHDRTPPYSKESEMSVLGSILIDHECINLLSLSSKHFYTTSHRHIYDAMRELYKSGIAIDLTTLVEQLKKFKRLDEIGGAYYLTELSEMVPTSANVEQYEKIVKSKWRLRQIIELSINMAEQVYSGSHDINDIINKGTDTLISLSEIEGSGKHVSDCLHDFNDKVDRRKAGEIVSINVPFVGSVELGETITVAARPSVGKSAFATQAMIECNFPVGYISLESTMDAVMGRMLAQATGIDSYRLKHGNVQQHEVEKLIKGSDKLANAKIWMDVQCGNLSELLALAHKWKAQYDIKMLVIDYIQLVDGVENENENNRLAKISRQITRFGTMNDVTIMDISQLSRAGIDRPQLHHLRGSGSIEQDSDIVAFLHRENDKFRENIELIIAKNKNGPLKNVDLNFNPPTLTFSEGV